MLREQIRQHPLAKSWRERQRKNQPRMQGTESKALQQLERNKKDFAYSGDGFEQKIEFSLIYAMLSAPDTYPREVVHQMLDEEDFEQYIHTKDGQVSYAQLSAILAYAAETNPSTTNITVPTTNKTTTVDQFKLQQEKQEGGGEEEEDNYDIQKNDVTVSQKLCKRILRMIVRYAEEHELDRETEIDELLTPVKRVAVQRIEKKEMQAIIPLYIGYSAALLTANPLPLIAGAMGMAAAPSNSAEIKNVERIISETGRTADVEQTGLLDEGEDF